MKAFLDTSVLIAVFYGDHVHHEASLALFTGHRKRDICCGAHSLAEVYSTLTRMPGKYRVDRDQAMLFISLIQERLAIIALDAEEYIAAIEKAAAAGVVGGLVYDALLASCAMKIKAETIFTWNLRHYERLWPDVKDRVRRPAGA